MIGPVLRTEIESTFQVVREKCSGDELVFLCPECGDRTGHRSLNLKTGQTFCFRCNKGSSNKGGFFAWARALGHRFNSSGSFNSVPVEDLLNQTTDKPIVPVVRPTELPAGFIPIERNPNCAYARYIGKMARRKNLDFEAFVEVGAGYTEEGIWEPYCIFPVTEYGLTVYYQGRTYVDVPGEPTKKFPSRKEVTFGASYWVYNIDEVRQTKPATIVIVESILNVLSLRRKFRELGVEGQFVPVCVFKHHISKVQIAKLLRCKEVREYCLLFDRDAIDKTWTSVGELCNQVKVTIAEMPAVDGNKKSDANDDVDLAWEAITNRNKYTASSVLDKMLSRPIGGHCATNRLTGFRICS